MVKNVNISLINLYLPRAITIRWKFDSMSLYQIIIYVYIYINNKKKIQRWNNQMDYTKGLHQHNGISQIYSCILQNQLKDTDFMKKTVLELV